MLNVYKTAIFIRFRMDKNNAKKLENKITGQIDDTALNASLWGKIIQQVVHYTQSQVDRVSALDLGKRWDLVSLS